MDRQDTEGADVSEGTDDSEILIVGAIHCTPSTVADAPLRPGVVLRFHRLAGGPNYVIEVGLDKARWREIPAGGDEVGEVADDTPKSDGLDGAG